jgi:hypothetical protein
MMAQWVLRLYPHFGMKEKMALVWIEFNVCSEK